MVRSESIERRGPDRSRRRVRQATTVVGILFAVGGLAFVVQRITANWTETSEAVGDSDARSLAFAFVVAAVGMTAIALPWPDVVRVLGGRLDRGEAVLLYFVGEIGKYLPGGVWPVVGRGELAHRAGLRRAAAYTGVLISLAVLYLSALLLAGALLPIVLWSGGSSASPAVFLLLLVPVGLGALHPAVLGRVVAVVERLSKRQLDLPLPSWGTMVGLVLRYLPAWLLIGSATWIVTVALGGEASWVEVCFATVLSWSAGFIVAPAPGGVGVREAVFVAAAVSLSSGVAGAAALVARLMFMLVDGSGAALCALVMSLRNPRGA